MSGHLIQYAVSNVCTDVSLHCMAAVVQCVAFEVDVVILDRGIDGRCIPCTTVFVQTIWMSPAGCEECNIKSQFHAVLVAELQAVNWTAQARYPHSVVTARPVS